MSNAANAVGYQPKLVLPQVKPLVIKKQTIHVVEVIVSGEDYRICDECELWCSKKKGNWGSGLINSDEDKHKAERTGLLGEMAFSKLSGLPINIEYQEGGSNNDFCLTTAKSKIDIKTAYRRPKYNAGLIRCGTNGKTIKLKSDIYIFGYVEKDLRQEKIAQIILVGGEYRENILKKKPQKARLGHHINYEVEYDQLIPIETLLLLIKG